MNRANRSIEAGIGKDKRAQSKRLYVVKCALDYEFAHTTTVKDHEHQKE